MLQVTLLIDKGWAQLSRSAEDRLYHTIDETDLEFTLSEFLLETQLLDKTLNPESIQSKILDNSLHWVDGPHHHKIPMVVVEVNLPAIWQKLSLSWREQVYGFAKAKENWSVRFTLPLFSAEPMYVWKDGEVVGKIYKKIPNDKTWPVLVDHHCLPYGLEVYGHSSHFISVVCRFKPLTPERGQLLLSVDLGQQLETVDRYLTLQSQEEGVVNLNLGALDYPLRFKAHMVNRIYSTKTAIGLGPYTFKVQKRGKDARKSIAPAYMLYGKYDLSLKTSLRFFDALITNGGVFNNAGVYFAYELASVWRDRVTVTSLLGLQEVSYKYRKDDSLFHQGIFPQGGELVVRHLFGWQNYNLVLGIFLSTSQTIQYENIWARFGKGIFWELNWLNWAYEDRNATMFGLSVGLPLISF